MVEMPLKRKDDDDKKMSEDVCLFDDDIRKGESISENASSGDGSDHRNIEQNMFYPQS